MGSIHPTAIVEYGTCLGEDVVIGPYCHVDKTAKLGDGVRLHSHVRIMGETELGDGVEVYPFAVLGAPAQFLGMKPGPSALRVGARTVIREHVTIHAGSPAHSQITLVGEDCFLMVNVHIAHDCVVGDRCVFANSVSLGGHVWVGEQVWIGGHAAVHQFTRLGDHCFIAGGAFVVEDVLPYAAVSIVHPYLAGVNVNGLKRRGFTRAQMHTIRATYKALFEGEGVFEDRLKHAEARFGDDDIARRILDFVRADAKRSLCQPLR